MILILSVSYTLNLWKAFSLLWWVGEVCPQSATLIAETLWSWVCAYCMFMFRQHSVYYEKYCSHEPPLYRFLSIVFLECHEWLPITGAVLHLYVRIQLAPFNRIFLLCNYCHYPWWVGDILYHKAHFTKFTCDGMSDHAWWSEGFH